jgi:hypothetical protein
LSPGNFEAGDFDDVDVNNFVLIFERCVVSFTPVGTALSQGPSEEKYAAFASRSCCSPCVADDVDDATVFASPSRCSSCVADDVDNVLCYPG